MLSQSEIASFYSGFPPPIPRVWKLSRKHFRAELCDGRFVKLSKFYHLSGKVMVTLSLLKALLKKRGA